MAQVLAVVASSPVVAPLLDIAIPVYNEERDLERSVRRLRRYLDHQFPFEARITVVDNASTDATWVIAQRLALELDGIRAMRLEEKGRGRAVRQAWLGSGAAVVAYMDVDLSTDLDGLLPLVAPVPSGHSDVAIGSRLAPGATVVRGPKRELISRAYNLLLKVALGTAFSDATCGFKAVRAAGGCGAATAWPPLACHGDGPPVGRWSPASCATPRCRPSPPLSASPSWACSSPPGRSPRARPTWWRPRWAPSFRSS